MAGFLGVSNLLDGRVTGSRRRHARYRAAATAGTIRATCPAHGRATASAVSAGVRPEKLQDLAALDDDGARGAASDDDATNVIDGRVIDASYVGVSTQYVVVSTTASDVTVYAQNLETSGVASSTQMASASGSAGRPSTLS